MGPLLRRETNVEPHIMKITKGKIRYIKGAMINIWKELFANIFPSLGSGAKNVKVFLNHERSRM